jgi:hypothetical protein
VSVLDPQIQEALKVRLKQANDVSAQFDFESEGSLATFWRQATPGTTYWRGWLPMKYLPGNVVGMDVGSLEVEGGDVETDKWHPDGPVRLVLKGQEGTAIWQFLGDDARSRIVFQLQRQGVRTLMEVDDTYLRFAPTLYGKNSAWTRTHAEAVANGTGYSIEMHRMQVPLMDGIICSTDFLANEYERVNPNVYVCPNSIDPTDWEGFEREESDVLRIGYYGSMSHVRDYPLVKKALKWAARQDGVEVVMIGFVPPGFRGRSFPWTDDIMEGRKNLGKIDVGIAPLVRNHWADGKSDVKALEYAMAGVMPIVQDAPPYDPWVKRGWDFVANTSSDWETMLRLVVSERGAVATWAAEAKRYVLEERTIQGNIHKWEEAVRG